MLNCGIPSQPRNLLDNSDFANPVNSRGKTSYSGGEYAIDRWKMQNDTNMNIMDGFIRITGSWDAQQILGNKLIGTYTYAIYAKVNVAGEYTQTIEIYENGSTIATSFCTAVGEWKIYTCTATFTGTNGTANPIVTINNRAGSVSDASIDVKWAALYEGSYDASTLPAYQPKGYAAELAEAQRYYQTIPALTHISGVTNTTTSFGAKYRIPTMRIAPTVSIASGQEVSIYTGDYSATTANYTMQYASKINQITFNVSLSAGSFVAYKPGELTFPVDIVLSADL